LRLAGQSSVGCETRAAFESFKIQKWHEFLLRRS
jgi:hypothetical protein